MAEKEKADPTGLRKGLDEFARSCATVIASLFEGDEEAIYRRITQPEETTNGN